MSTLATVDVMGIKFVWIILGWAVLSYAAHGIGPLMLSAASSSAATGTGRGEVPLAAGLPSWTSESLLQQLCLSSELAGSALAGLVCCQPWPKSLFFPCYVSLTRRASKESTHHLVQAVSSWLQIKTPSNWPDKQAMCPSPLHCFFFLQTLFILVTQSPVFYQQKVSIFPYWKERF